MKKFFQEFKEFALRGNVMDMAVAVIIGGAFTGIVTSLTENFINPLIQTILGQESYTLADVAGFAGNFVSAVVNFIILALILFIMIRSINKLIDMTKKKEEEEVTTKECPFCCSEINIKATRCPNCTSILDDAVAEEAAEVLQ